MWVNSAAHRKDFLQAERLQRWVVELQNIFKDRIYLSVRIRALFLFI